MATILRKARTKDSEEEPPPTSFDNPPPEGDPPPPPPDNNDTLHPIVPHSTVTPHDPNYVTMPDTPNVSSMPQWLQSFLHTLGLTTSSGDPNGLGLASLFLPLLGQFLTHNTTQHATDQMLQANTDALNFMKGQAGNIGTLFKP